MTDRIAASSALPGQAENGREALSLTALAAVLYLALPSLLFLTFWVAQPLGGFLALLMLSALTLFWRQHRRVIAWPAAIPWRLLICASVAAAWVGAGGIGHLVFANNDWQIRDAVFRDLTLTGWPVDYASDRYSLALLRIPLGYYLVPALAAKIFGIATLNFFVWLWTALGAALVLLLATERQETLRGTAIVAATFVLFSGMKFIGLVLVHLMYGGKPLLAHLSYYSHMWAQLAHYPSMTSELYWCPNHGLPAFLLAALWWRYRDEPQLQRVQVFAAPLALLWSPFAVIGMTPFGLHTLARRWREFWDGFPYPAALASIIAALPALLYLLLDAGKEPHFWLFANMMHKPMFVIGDYFLFVLLEFGVLIALMRRLAPRPLLALIAAMLALLPLYWFGFWSDLAQHAAVPGLTMLALMAGEWLAKAPRWREWPMAGKLLLAVLAIGAIEPLQEWGMTLWQPAWAASRACTLADVWHSDYSLPPTMTTYVAQVTTYPAYLQAPYIVSSQHVKGERCWPATVVWPVYFSEMWGVKPSHGRD